MAKIHSIKPFKLMCVVEAGIPPVAAPRAFQKLESIVSLKGRKFYGVYDSSRMVYCAGTRMEEGDDAAALNLEVLDVPGGFYAVEKLTGPYRELVQQVSGTFDTLEREFTKDATRLPIEFYRRHTEFLLMLPITQ